MNGRHYKESLRHLRRLASEAELSGESLAGSVRPFIEEWRTPHVPNLNDHPQDHPAPTGDGLTLSPAALANLSAHIRTLGMSLHKSGLKGIHYHNHFARHVAALAPAFDCRGFTESRARFADPDAPTTPSTKPTPPLATPLATPLAAPLAGRVSGRVDVVWTRRKIVLAVFEIDSTVKARSFQKLKEAAAPHRLWVYFGKDIWSFRTFLHRADAPREITPILVPHTFVPSFDHQTDSR